MLQNLYSFRNHFFAKLMFTLKCGILKSRISLLQPSKSQVAQMVIRGRLKFQVGMHEPSPLTTTTTRAYVLKYVLA